MRRKPSIATSSQTRFTLLELLAAMAVFTVILTMVFSMIASAQRAWNAVDRNTRIYESARILMDVLTRELQSAVASDEVNNEIPFYVGTNSPSGSGNSLSRFMLSFVSASPLAGSGDARLAEVSYTYDDNVFRRRQVEDDNSGWDFYGDTSNAWVNTPNTTGFQRVIEGIEDLSFTCYDDSGTMATGTYTHMPSVVRVSFSLFDPDALEVSDATRRQQLIDETRRSFTKVIFLRSE